MIEACRVWRVGLVLALALCVAGASVAQERLFEVVPPESLPFNWPPPPREGRPDFFRIAEDGRPLCVIVHPAEARAMIGLSALLARYLELVTGATFETLSDALPVPAGLGAIHLGETREASKSPLNLPDVRYGRDTFPNLNGYLVRTTDSRTLTIRGLTDNAVRAGVVGFLRRYVGVRQYWLNEPGGPGETLPRRPSLRLPEVEWSDWPYWYSRVLSQGRSLMPGSRNIIMLNFARTQGVLPCGENYAQWLPPAKYAKEHPEYYCMINGQRRPPPPESAESKGWQPCVSNPDVVRIMAEGIIEYFRRNPQAPGINCSINDGGRDCACDGCRAMDTPNSGFEGMADRYVAFTNRICEVVEKEFPDKIIVMLAYAAVANPPLSVRPHRMILPVFTAGGRNIYARVDQWLKAGAKEIGLYIHHDDFVFFVLPKVDPHHMARRLRYALGSGGARVFYMESHPLWPTTGCVHYVTAELLWDPRQDVDALMNDYCAGLFGPAAEPMRRFYDALESGVERWVDEAGEAHWFGKEISPLTNGRKLEQFRVLNIEEADRASEALAQARELAQADPRAAQHVEAVSLAFGLQHLGVREYWTAQRLRNVSPRSEADAHKVLADARALLALRRESADYIENVLKKPPANRYALFEYPGRRSRNETYKDLASREPLPAYLGAVTAGLDALADYLKKSLGPRKAVAWLKAAAAAEEETALVKALEAAQVRASGVRMDNLLTDPGFEEIGKKIGPDETTPGREVELTQEQHKPLVRLWFPEKSPYRVLLQQNEVHAGHYALTLQHCHRARHSFSARAEPNRRYRIAFWVNCNEAPGSYSYDVFGHVKVGDESKNVLLAQGTISKTGAWQEIVADVETPETCSWIMVFVYVNGQSAESRFTIDDRFIGQYPK